MKPQEVRSAATPSGQPRLTTDPSDPRLGHGTGGEGMNEVYLVLSEEERGKGFVRPYCEKYVHATELGGCGVETRMGIALSETYARRPSFYGATYCVGCQTHRPVGEDGEFYWVSSDGKPLVHPDHALNDGSMNVVPDEFLWKVGT